jgi:hypothetical protein
MKTIEAYGPMTQAELLEILGGSKGTVYKITTNLTKPSKTISKRLYVKTYVFDQEGQKRYPRPVFAIGNKPCAEKPALDIPATQKRYREKRKGHMLYNNVFNLGLRPKSALWA